MEILEGLLSQNIPGRVCTLSLWHDLLAVSPTRPPAPRRGAGLLPNSSIMSYIIYAWLED